MKIHGVFYIIAAILVVFGLMKFARNAKLIQEKESNEYYRIRVHIHQCPGNWYTQDMEIDRLNCLKIDNYRVGVPELRVHNNNTGYYVYGPIALNVCNFTVDTLK